MSPIAHFLVGWGVANAGGLHCRERTCVAIAGIIPDADRAFVATLRRRFPHPEAP